MSECNTLAAPQLFVRTGRCAMIRAALRVPLPAARVVKLVDTGDLKSPDHCDRAGSIPAPGTNKNKGLMNISLILSTKCFCM